MNIKNILIWTGGIIVTFVLLFFAYKLTSGPQKTEFPEINKVVKGDHTKWSRENKNILVEYSDIQCPACKNFHDILKIFESSGSADFSITQKITLVYRHFPLFSIHKNAFSAAYAAEAAGLQEKFWEMVDLQYEKQAQWSDLADPGEFFTDLAKELGLDIDKFKKDMNSSEVKNKVQSHLTEGESIGVNATPTFFLNGKKVDVRSIDEFKNLLKSL